MAQKLILTFHEDEGALRTQLEFDPPIGRDDNLGLEQAAAVDMLRYLLEDRGHEVDRDDTDDEPYGFDTRGQGRDD
jgi:hypothetical protein